MICQDRHFIKLFLPKNKNKVAAKDFGEAIPIKTMNQIESDGEKYWKAYDKRYAAQMSQVENAGEKYWKEFQKRYAFQKQHLQKTLHSRVKPAMRGEVGRPVSEPCVTEMQHSIAKSQLKDIEQKENERRAEIDFVDKRVNKILRKLEIIAEQLTRSNQLLQELCDKQ